MNKKNTPYLFIFIALLFFGLFFFIENKNESFLLNDFKVYYSASQALLDGGTPYGVAYGLSSGFFKYSPVSLFLFSPYTIMSFDVAKTIHFMVIALLAIGAFMFCFNFSNRYFDFKLTKRTGFLSLLLLILAVHLTRELHLGNVNMIMLFFFLLAIHLMNDTKTIWSALIFAILILMKPYFLILVLPLVVARKWKLISWIVIFIPTLLLLPSLFLGFDENILLLKNWSATMSDHNSAMISEHTFTSIVFSYSGIKLALYWQYIFIGIVALVYGIIRAKAFFRIKVYDSKMQLIDFSILLALIPNLVITDSQHFLFSLPLIALILAHLKQDLKWYLISVFVILLFFYGANSNDFLGNPLSDKFDTLSTIGISNLALIGLLIWLNYRNEKRKRITLFS